MKFKKFFNFCISMYFFNCFQNSQVPNMLYVSLTQSENWLWLFHGVNAVDQTEKMFTDQTPLSS